jgi:hypothetical protein
MQHQFDDGKQGQGEHGGEADPQDHEMAGLAMGEVPARFFPLCTPNAAAITLCSICQKLGGLLSTGSSINPRPKGCPDSIVNPAGCAVVARGS